jgi:hypothetical protein
MLLWKLAPMMLLSQVPPPPSLAWFVLEMDTPQDRYGEERSKGGGAQSGASLRHLACSKREASLVLSTILLCPSFRRILLQGAAALQKDVCSIRYCVLASFAGSSSF